MTFRISPRPRKGTGAYQQAVDLKRTLEKGGWKLALTQRGPTPGHVPIMSAMWALSCVVDEYPVTTLQFGGHKLVFSYEEELTMHVEVDDMPTSFTIEALRLMLE